MIVAPMFHAWGFSQLIFAASMACTVVTRRKFDPEATLDLVDRHQATGLVRGAGDVRPHHGAARRGAAPLQRPVTAIRRGIGFADATRRRHRVHGPVRRRDLQQLQRHRGRHDRHRHPGRTCAPHPTPRAGPPGAPKSASWTPEFNELPTGEVGSIYVRNNTQFDGYTSGSTKDFHDGFMSSGDVGYLDEAGRLFVVGRDDEMIVSGGENVYPIEVEKTLAAHPEVAEAAVIGVDDEQYGQRLAAFVVLEPAPRRRTARRRSSSTCGRTWPTTKCPREITVLDELPRSSTGKILRAELQVAGRRGDAAARTMRRPRPLPRAALELANAANGLRPLARKGYSTVLVFWFGWPASEVPRRVPLRLAARRAAAGPPRRLRGTAREGRAGADRGVLGILGVIKYRGVTTPGPVLEAGLRDQLGDDYEEALDKLPQTHADAQRAAHAAAGHHRGRAAATSRRPTSCPTVRTAGPTSPTSGAAAICRATARRRCCCRCPAAPG